MFPGFQREGNPFKVFGLTHVHYNTLTSFAKLSTPNGKNIVPFNIGELLTGRGLAGPGRWK